MLNIKVKDIVEATRGVLLCGDGEQIIEHISIDSRSSQGNDIFVPIIGEKVDAHQFIDQAFGNGCVATLTCEHKKMDDTRAWIYVNDTKEALQAIGYLCRHRVMVPAVGVTGSVGKTTTREMIATALSAGKKVFKTGKNYNSQIGVPITLSEMSNDFDVAVLELGMNVPGELELISKMAQLSMAVITNIGVAHIEYFGTSENICKEKMTITKGLKEDGILFLNGDDPLLYEYRELTGYPYVLYGTREECEYRAVNVRMENGKYCFDFIYHGKKVPVVLSVLGMHNVINAAGALAVADRSGVSVEDAAKALSTFTGFQNRLQIYKIKGYTLIDDTYNASPDSMKAGITVLTGMDEPGRKIAVLGDMFELGKNAPMYHYEVGEFAAKQQIDELLLIGELAKNIGAALEDSQCAIKQTYFDSNEGIANYLNKTLSEGDVVYLKASNGMKLKEITAMLQKDAQ